MTEPQTDLRDRIPIGRNITYAVRGFPAVPNAYGTGFLVPTEVSLTYRATADSRLGRFHAYVKGQWLRDGEVVSSGEKLPGQHYYGDPAGWPEWLAEEARLHDPDSVPPPADRAAVLLWAADDLATAFGDPMVKHIGAIAASHLRRRARELEGREAGEEQPETPLEKRLRCSERRNDELRTECKRRGKTVLEYAEKIERLEKQLDEVRTQLGAEILRAGQAEAELRRLAAEAQQQPAAETPCGPAPDQCDTETGEPCTDHEREQAHAEGEHAFCGPECAAVERSAAADTLHGESVAHIADDVAPHCAGFPTTCPNPIPVPPAPPHHDGGIRCGCYDEETE